MRRLDLLTTVRPVKLLDRQVDITLTSLMSDEEPPHGDKRSRGNATSSDNDDSAHKAKQARTTTGDDSSSGFDGFESDAEDAGFEEGTFSETSRLPGTKGKGKSDGAELDLWDKMKAAEAARESVLAWVRYIYSRCSDR